MMFLYMAIRFYICTAMIGFPILLGFMWAMLRKPKRTWEEPSGDFRKARRS